MYSDRYSMFSWFHRYLPLSDRTRFSWDMGPSTQANSMHACKLACLGQIMCLQMCCMFSWYKNTFISLGCQKGYAHNPSTCDLSSVYIELKPSQFQLWKRVLKHCVRHPYWISSSNLSILEYNIHSVHSCKLACSDQIMCTERSGMFCWFHRYFDLSDLTQFGWYMGLCTQAHSVHAR